MPALETELKRVTPAAALRGAEPPASSSKTETILATRRLNAWFGRARVLRNVSLDFYDRLVTAVIGPSGCGKSTLLRCLNRMHETVPGAITEGDVMLEDASIYHGNFNAIAVRRHIGMVFQRPTPFPTMSIRDNVAAGLRIRIGRGPSKSETDEIVQGALDRAGLWGEVKDRLGEHALGLSGGQQQRLCIARALATRPRVILLDEPTASLDPLSTQTIEELVYELRQSIAVIIVTHNMQQAARVSDRTAFMLAGEMIVVAPTTTLFTNPRDSRTESYVTGRFG
jgi:phosphate transport system ATP-binding protein